MKYILFSLLFPSFGFSQSIPKEANVIVVKNVSFAEVCNALLDHGYSIEAKDSELQTVRTEPIKYPKYWNGAYKISVRIKDSAALFSGVYQCPYETSLTSLIVGQTIEKGTWEKAYHHTNRKGQTLPKSMIGYPFLLMNEFAKTLGSEISYLKN